MSARLQIVDRMRTDLRDQSGDVRRAAECIFEFIANIPSVNARHLTYSMLAEKCPSPQLALLQAIQYLCGEVNVLEMNFEFIEDDCIEQLSRHEVSVAYHNRKLYHPLTGEVVENFEEKIYSYFTLGRQVLELPESE